MGISMLFGASPEASQSRKAEAIKSAPLLGAKYAPMEGFMTPLGSVKSTTGQRPSSVDRHLTA
jgi:hypothetical protein